MASDMTIGRFYLVVSNLDRAPLADHLLHGYESRWDFYRALRRLLSRWKGRIGECVDERHGFLLLRFHDTPGGKPDEEWLPLYLLEPVEKPQYIQERVKRNDILEELDEAFGFD